MMSPKKSSFGKDKVNRSKSKTKNVGVWDYTSYLTYILFCFTYILFNSSPVSPKTTVQKQRTKVKMCFVRDNYSVVHGEFMDFMGLNPKKVYYVFIYA